MSTLSGEDAAKPNSFAKRDWLTVIAIGVLVSLPLYLYGLPLSLDLNHHYRTALGFYESIVNGNYYPSWHPSTNGGYGDLLSLVLLLRSRQDSGTYKERKTLS